MSVERFNEFHTIFLGYVVGKKTGNNEVSYSFKPYKIYKGSATGGLLMVRSEANAGYCGLPALNDTSLYLIYADPVDSPRFTLYTSRCMSPINYRTGRPFDYRRDTAFLNRHVQEAARNGIREFRFPDGTVSARGEYRDGLEVGKWTYYKQGKISSKGGYRSGNKDSVWTAYDPESGRILNLNGFDNGVSTPWQKTFFDGRLYDETYPERGSDKWLHIIYHSNGKVRVRMEMGPPECRYKRCEVGKMEGWTREYYENGRLKDEGTYHRGFATGIHRYYDESGKLIKTEAEPDEAAIDEQISREAESKH